MKKLGLDYVDLYLIHWPNPKAFRPDFETRNLAVWKAMEAGVKAGKIRPLGTGKIFEVPELADLASKYNKSIAQVVLRWSLHKGYLPLPKSVTPARIKENAEIFDFDLSIEDIAFIDSLHGKAGLAKNPDEVDF